MKRLLVLLLAATGCGLAPTTVEGSVAGEPMSEIQTVLWGGRYIVLIDEPLDCIDLAWVNHTYTEGMDLGDVDFAALQFTFSRGVEVLEGTFSVQGAAEVNAKFLDYRDGIFDASDEYRARDGFLSVGTVSDKDRASGDFELDFGDGQALSGEFEAQWCVNLPD